MRLSSSNGKFFGLTNNLIHVFVFFKNLVYWCRIHFFFFAISETLSFSKLSSHFGLEIWICCIHILLPFLQPLQSFLTQKFNGVTCLTCNHYCFILHIKSRTLHWNTNTQNSRKHELKRYTLFMIKGHFCTKIHNCYIGALCRDQSFVRSFTCCV